MKEASEEKLQKDLNKELQNTAKLTVDLKEFQNKAKHVETLESAVEVKDKALNNLKLSHDKLKEKLKESTCKLRANTKSTAKLNEKLERKNEKIEKLKAKEVEQKNTIKGNMKEIKALNSENQLLHKSLSSGKEYIKKLKKSLEYFKEKSNSQIKGEIYKRIEKIELLQEQVKELMKEKEYLQELLDLTESPVVTTYEKGKYVDSIRQVYIKLLNMKVGRNNVKEVIETVLGDLTNVMIDGPLPSAALTSMLFTEGRTLANLHVATELQNNENSTLHYDETSKFGKKAGSIQITAGNKTYAVGLFDEDTGSSERLFDSIKECLEKTADNLGQITKSNELPKLLLNIKNTMTYRHSVNDCVDDMLEKWKTEVAKVSVSGFEEMNESAKKIYTSINKLRCNLHFLLGLADAAEKGLNEYDKIVQNVGVIGSKVRIQKHGESSPTRKIRTAAKHF